MKLANLTEKDLIEVFRLYEECCGSGRDLFATYLPSPKSILEKLKSNCSGLEYRVGSKWDDHSKLYLDTNSKQSLIVRFSPNFDPESRKGKDFREAEEAGKDFESRVREYLR